MSTSFFDLSRELRDWIYFLAFEPGAHAFVEGGLRFTLSFRKPDADTPHALPPWLFTNKQILEEGLEQYYREVVCTDINL